MFSVRAKGKFNLNGTYAYDGKEMNYQVKQATFNKKLTL